jgi:hypothetical protein
MCEIYRFPPTFRGLLINSSPRRIPSRAQEPGSRFLKDMDSGFRRNDGIGINQSFLSCLHIYESRLVFEGNLIISTVSFLISAVSFRAKARNPVTAPSSGTSFCQLTTQRGINHFASNDIVMRASLARHVVRKLYCPIRNFVSIFRAFLLPSEEGQDEGEEIHLILSPHPIPLPSRA